MLTSGMLLRIDTLALCALARMGGTSLTVGDLLNDLQMARGIDTDASSLRRGIDRLIAEGHLTCTGWQGGDRNPARAYSLTARGKIEAGLRLSTILAGFLGDAAP